MAIKTSPIMTVGMIAPNASLAGFTPLGKNLDKMD
jgi:hypothetical protein